ncbi:MAG: substrate-binding domain-containing protein, partial [Actinomycetes bacterium]
MRQPRKTLATTGALLAAGLLLAACSSSSTNASSSTPAASSSVPQISAADFTSDFSAMTQLTDLAAQGDGLIGVLLPDTTSSTRYVQYDAPYLKQAFEAAGLTSDQFLIQNAQGSASKMQSQAEAMINQGASVLLVDPLDTGSGAAIEENALKAGVAVVDYDRLVTGGPKDRYYVSFNNVQVGNLIGQGEVDCIDAWKVANPNILIMNGDPKDNNAKLFNQGYMEVLQPKFDDGTYTKAGEPAGTWDPQTAATTFEQQYTDNPKINAVVTPNDDNANAVISVLKKNQIKANTFPTTGQDASIPGLQNVLTGYQCGTVYKPIFAEAQAAAALAIFLRAGQTPPSSLVNSTTKDTVIGADIPSVYT